MHRRKENRCTTNIFIMCHFHAFLHGAETHDFAKYFHIFEMKSKFLTKLKDWNENARPQGKDMHC